MSEYECRPDIIDELLNVMEGKDLGDVVSSLSFCFADAIARIEDRTLESKLKLTEGYFPLMSEYIKAIHEELEDDK